MCRGLELSLSRDPSSLDSDYLATPLQGPTPHPLLQVGIPLLLPCCRQPRSLSPSQVSSSCLLQRLVRDPSDNSLLPALLWLLVARQQMPAAFPLDMPTSVAIATLVRNCLEEACGGCHSNTVGLQVAVDCLALSLAVPEVQSAVGEEWVVAVVPCVAGLLEEEGEDHQLTHKITCADSPAGSSAISQHTMTATSMHRLLGSELHGKRALPFTAASLRPHPLPAGPAPPTARTACGDSSSVAGAAAGRAPSLPHPAAAALPARASLSVGAGSGPGLAGRRGQLHLKP